MAEIILGGALVLIGVLVGGTIVLASRDKKE